MSTSPDIFYFFAGSNYNPALLHAPNLTPIFAQPQLSV
jgi:hypothetical protein